MSQPLTDADFQAALGTPPGDKQNLPETQTGGLLASDIPSVRISEAVTGVSVVGKTGTSLAAPHLYVPALAQPNHNLAEQSRNGRWFELAQTVDLRCFGDVVDNRGADIAPALNNFIDYAREKGGGAVMIPPGMYSIESPVVGSLDGGSDNFSIAIMGYGTEVSRLVIDGASVSSGPTFSSTNRAGFFRFEGFSLLADGVVNGRPLTATMPIGGSRRNCSHIVRDLLVQGLDAHLNAGSPSSDHFTNGFNFSGAWRMVFENNHVAGRIVDSVKTHADWSDSSILWDMADGLLIDGAYAPIIRDSQFYFIGKPILCRGYTPGDPNPPGVEAERALFQNIRCPTCKTAITWNRTGAEPEFIVTDCFFDFRDYGIDVKGARLGQIYRNAFFQKTDTDPARVIPADIQMDHCIDFNIDQNIHHEAGDTRRRAIHLKDTSTDSGHRTDHINITRNRVSEVAVLDVYLKKNTNTSKVVFEPGPVEGTLNKLVDDSTATQKTDLSLPHPFVISVRINGGSQSIPNNSWTNLQWSVVTQADQFVDAAWSSGAASRITVPNFTGIRYAQIRTNVEFDTNGSGDRRVQLRKNAAEPVNGLLMSASALSSAPTALAGTSDWIAVSPGDYLEVRVLQNSGGSLGIGAPSSVTVSFR